MNNRISRMIPLLLLLILVGLPVAAQDDGESDDALNTVVDAIDALNSFDNVHVTGTLAIQQEISSGGRTINSDITQDLDTTVIYVDEAINALESTVTQAITFRGGIGEGAMTMDVILVDDTFYGRTRDVSGTLTSLTLPDQWVRMDSDEAEDLGDVFEDAESAAELLGVRMLYPVNENTVTEVVENETVEIDGEPVRHWTLTLDAVAAAEETGFAELLDNAGVNPRQLGLEEDEAAQRFMENATLTVDTFVSTETGHLRRLVVDLTLDTTLDALGQEVGLVQESTSTFNYGDFNADVTIQAPDVPTEDEEADDD